jgi:hypothetical protein
MKGRCIACLTALLAVGIGLATAGTASGDPLPTLPANIYVSGTSGNDANDGLSTSTPVKTIQKAINMVPRLFQTSGTIHVATGTYNEAATIEEIKGSGSVSLKLKGYINATAGSFTNSPTLTGTSTGGNTSNFPNINTTFNAANFGSAGTQAGRYLHLTGGTGFSALDEYNWYVIENNTSATQLLIVGQWRSATPNATTTYEIYLPANMTTINGQLTRLYGLAVLNASNIQLSTLRVINAQQDGIKIHTSVLDIEPEAETVNLEGISDIFLVTTSSNSQSASFRYPASGLSIQHSRVGQINAFVSNADQHVGLNIGEQSGIRVVAHSMFKGSVANTGLAVNQSSSVQFLVQSLGIGNLAVGPGAGFSSEFGSTILHFEKNRSTGNWAGIIGQSNSIIGFTDLNVFQTSTTDGIFLNTNSHLFTDGFTFSNVQLLNNLRSGAYIINGSTCATCGAFTYSGNPTTFRTVLNNIVALPAQTLNPAPNEVSLYIDESTNRTGGAAADCALVARKSDGVEVVVALLTIDGVCP